LRNIFSIVAVILLLSGALIAILPTMVIPDLIYPQRIDSTFIAFHQKELAEEHPVYFNPQDLNLDYLNLDIHTHDSIVLKGWYIPFADTEAPTLVVVHDVNESKIRYLNLAKQMHDRGLKVFLYDLRAHGSSGGDKFSPGFLSVNDIKTVLDSLDNKEETKHVVIMGVGIGAGIAIQAAALDYRCEVLIAQCPYNDLSDYVHRYAEREWTGMKRLYSPVLERKLYLVLGYRDDDLILSDITASLRTPSLFISASEDSITLPSEARALFDSSAAEQKDLILVRKATHDNVEVIGGDAYYNVITEFINTSIPKKAKKVRYKKLT
jgi:uncharacterized protein